MNKQEKILQECKLEVAARHGRKNWLGIWYDEVSILFAHRMAELFAEWIRAQGYLTNGGDFWGKFMPKIKNKKGDMAYETTSELYTVFLNDLNKEK